MVDAIKVGNLRKTYPGGKNNPPKDALKGVDLTIPQGSFFGLLGPNGAGKSTLINILAGLVVKSSGDVSIMGHDIVSDPRAAKSAIGVVPQELVVDTFFPVYQALETQAGYYGIRPEDRKTDEILEALGLSDKRDMTAKQLSGGMKRRVMVAKAMVHNPKVLILDEPTAGVDIDLREQLWDYVAKLNKQGTTIIVTTHYLQEAETLCDHLAFINHGQIIRSDKKSVLMDSLGYKEVIVEFAEKDTKSPTALSKYTAEIICDNKIKIHYQANEKPLGALLQEIQKCKIAINDITTSQADLDYVFRKIVA